MINNLNLHSAITPQVDTGASSEMSLMNLIGKGSSLDESLNQDDILALLSDEGEVNFSDILSTESDQMTSEDSKLTTKEIKSLDVLIQNLDNLDLNSDEVKEISGLLEKLNLKNEKADLSKLVKLSKENPELQSKVASLIELNSKNNSENKLLKEVSELIVKDNSTTVKASNLTDMLSNKAKINKMLGLSSDELIDVKRDSKIKDTSLVKPSKEKLAKNFLVEDNKLIKNNSNLLNTIVLKDTKKSSPELEQTQSNELNLDSSSPDEGIVKLDNSTIIKTNKVNEVTKSMDLTQIMSKANTQNEVISKIQDYIIQSKVSSDPNVNLTFNHTELGDVNLNVQKVSGDNLAVTIISNNAESLKFFTENKSELLQTLTNSGINISEMKLESTATTNKDSNSNNQNFSESKQNFSGSKQGEQERESKRREELWELFDKEIA